MNPELFPFADCSCPAEERVAFPRFDRGGVPASNAMPVSLLTGMAAGAVEGAGPDGDFPSLSIYVQLNQEREKVGSKIAIVRKAETLFRNLQNMIERRGVECAAFCTLTFKENLTDRKEAQRRFNSMGTSFLRRIDGLEWIAAVERQARGAIHYHLALALPWDVRTGFDFAAYGMAQAANRAGNQAEALKWQAVYVQSATPALRQWWARLRRAAAKYGFGRCETLPIKSNAEGVARYVGGYVSKEFSMREARDKGLRTLRYSLEKRPYAARWSWAGGLQAEWRKGCSVLGAIIGTDDLSGVLGKRWAWYWRDEIAAFARYHMMCLAAVEEMLSDNCDAQERVERASKLAEVIFAYEARNGRPGESAEAAAARLARKAALEAPSVQEGSAGADGTALAVVAESVALGEQVNESSES